MALQQNEDESKTLRNKTIVTIITIGIISIVLYFIWR